MKSRILVTGFCRFLDFKKNPTEELMKRLAASPQRFPGAELKTLVLPVDYAPSEELFLEAFQEFKPQAVIFFGLNYKIDKLDLERLAVNIDDTPKPDNQGIIRQGQKIDPEGPAAYWSTLPLQEMSQALEQATIPVSFSNHAGAYLCNHLFYFGLHTARQQGHKIPVGFIHVPPYPEQISNPPGSVQEMGLDLTRRVGMSPKMLYEAACICLDTLLDHIS
jgi:pyroglutamyl-peptidase